MTLRSAACTALTGAGLILGTAAGAQPAPGADGPMRDPFGDATVLRADAEAQAAARFASFDSNADGSLSPEELAAARPQGRPPGAAGQPEDGHGPGPGRGAGRMARMMDANGDGKVSKDEFVAGSLRRFDMMDADHDGKLTKAERQEAFEQMRARMEAMRALGGGDGPPPPGD